MVDQRAMLQHFLQEWQGLCGVLDERQAFYPGVGALPISTSMSARGQPGSKLNMCRHGLW